MVSLGQMSTLWWLLGQSSHWPQAISVPEPGREVLTGGECYGPVPGLYNRTCAITLYHSYHLDRDMYVHIWAVYYGCYKTEVPQVGWDC